MPLRHGGQRLAQAVEQLGRDSRLHTLAAGFGVSRLVQPGPAPGKPIGLVGLVAFGRLKLFFQMIDEVARGLGHIIVIDHALRLQARSIDVADRGMLADLRVHQRLGERRLIALIVTEAAIAPHVDHDVAMEGLAIFDRQLARKGHRFRIVAIHMQDRCLNALRHVGRIGRAARKLRAGGEADLVVDDEVDAAAGIVTRDTGKAEAFPDDTLARKGRVAMDQHRQDLLMLAQIVAERLLRAHLAQHHRIDRFKVRGVGDQRHMDLDPVKFAVGRCTEVIFDVARTADIFGVCGAAGKFVENDAKALGHHIGQHVQAAAMGHAIDDFADARLTAIFDDRFERRDHGLATIQTKTLGADIFAAQEFLILLALDDLGQDRLLAFRREDDFLVLALQPVLQELALLHVGDVHIFQANIAAIIGAQNSHDLTDGRELKAQRPAQENLFIEVGQTMIFGCQIGRQVALGQAERIEIGGQMTAHAIGADQHLRADGVLGRLGYVGVRHWLARGLGGGLYGHLHLRRVQRAGQFVRIGQRPVRAGPAWALLDFKILVLVTHHHIPSVPRAVAVGQRTAGVQPGRLTGLVSPSALLAGLYPARTGWQRP